MAYKLGETIIATATFLDSTGAVTDPTTLSLYVREEIDGTELEWLFTPPATATTTPAGMNAVVRDSAGVFHVNFVARKPERHTFHWRANAGTSVSVAQGIKAAFVNHAEINLVEP